MATEALERVGAHVSWRSIWVGFFIAGAVQLLLQLFGLAIALSAWDPAGGARGIAVWQGIWAIISTLSAYFFGAWVAALIGAPLGRAQAMVLGAAVWAFSTVVGLLLVTSGALGSLGVAVGNLATQAVAGGQAARALFTSGAAITTAWVAFATLVVGLGCALAGAALGASERMQRRVREPRVLATPRPEPRGV